MASDRELLRQAADEIEILARCLRVEVELQRWEADGDDISGGVAADGLDQALGLLAELHAGRADELAGVVRRIAAMLPPPLD